MCIPLMLRPHIRIYICNTLTDKGTKRNTYMCGFITRFIIDVEIINSDTHG